MGHLRKIQGYDVIATLGTGARSTIYAVRDRTHQVYALKHIIKDHGYLAATAYAGEFDFVNLSFFPSVFATISLINKINQSK